MRILRALRLIPMSLALTACIGPVNTTAPGLAVSDEVPTRMAQPDLVPLPPMKVFATPLPAAPMRANSEIAQDFLDLSFRLESGRSLPVFTRFEGPIRVAVAGEPDRDMIDDLRRLLRRLRDEAGIDIDFGTGPNQVTVEAVPSRRIRQYLPQAACFVVPGITGLNQYRAARNTDATDWAKLRKREKIAIFVPNDVSPQESRDCLHEELAQAIGPLNDLYRLPDSTFNDDNMNSVLTGFDMLILRATYAPELQSGMSREQVQRLIPGILARLNPAGAGRVSQLMGPTPPEWAGAVQTALGGKGNAKTRTAAAYRALTIARDNGWQDHRLAFAHYVVARQIQITDRLKARAHLSEAYSIYRRNAGTRIHTAQIATQLAAHAIYEGDGAQALTLLKGQADVARQGENAALLASIQMMRAEALELMGHAPEAAPVRLDSLGWARYGFGPDWAVRAKLNEIAALRPSDIQG
jgi:hypothetical protein